MSVNLRVIGLVVASVLSILLAQLAHAQSGPPPGAMPVQPAQSPPPQHSLEAMKQHRLEQISHRLAMLQQEQACVQNAADQEQLHACKPLPPPPR